MIKKKCIICKFYNLLFASPNTLEKNLYPVSFKSEIAFLEAKTLKKNFYPLCKNTKNFLKRGKSHKVTDKTGVFKKSVKLPGASVVFSKFFQAQNHQNW